MGKTKVTTESTQEAPVEIKETKGHIWSRVQEIQVSAQFNVKTA